MILRGRRAAVETWLTIVLYGRLYNNLSLGEIRIFISSTNSTENNIQNIGYVWPIHRYVAEISGRI